MQKRQLAISILAFHLLIANLCTLRAQTKNVTVALEKSVITLHEPTIINITVDNPSSVSLHFDPGYDYELIEVRVVDPEGRVLKRQPPVQREGMRFSRAVDLAAGTSNTIPVLLNDWFSFNRPGNYEIEVGLPQPEVAPSKETSIVSSKMILTVAARNQAKLESTCANLVRLIKDSQSASTAIVAARALAEVDDPVAVSFLAEAMKRKEFAGLMINALTRLKTDEAIQVLIAASQSSDSETRILAQSALVSLGLARNR